MYLNKYKQKLADSAMNEVVQRMLSKKHVNNINKTTTKKVSLSTKPTVKELRAYFTSKKQS
jgi:hypothetical protein